MTTPKPLIDPAIWIQKLNNLCPQGAPLGTSAIREKAAIIPGLYQTGRLKKDPTDNVILACALEARADFIVSGDKHLRNLKQFHGIRIIHVKEFVERVRKG